MRGDPQKDGQTYHILRSKLATLPKFRTRYLVWMNTTDSEDEYDLTNRPNK